MLKCQQTENIYKETLNITTERLQNKNTISENILINFSPYQFSLAQLNHLVMSWLFVTPWITTCQASLSITNYI